MRKRTVVGLGALTALVAAGLYFFGLGGGWPPWGGQGKAPDGQGTTTPVSKTGELADGVLAVVVQENDYLINGKKLSLDEVVAEVERVKPKEVKVQKEAS